MNNHTANTTTMLTNFTKHMLTLPIIAIVAFAVIYFISLPPSLTSTVIELDTVEMSATQLEKTLKFDGTSKLTLELKRGTVKLGLYDEISPLFEVMKATNSAAEVSLFDDGSIAEVRPLIEPEIFFDKYLDFVDSQAILNADQSDGLNDK